MTRSRNCSVAVVGGGLSGLTAARRLVDLGLQDLLLVEARSEVGGRTMTQTVSGVTLNCGGAWTGTTQDDIKRLAASVGVETFLSTHEGAREELRFEAGTLTRRGQGAAEPMPRGAVPVVEAFDSLVQGIDVLEPWASSRAREFDAVTVDAWIASQTEDAHSRAFLNELFGRITAVSPRRLSLLALLAYQAQAGGFSNHQAGTVEERFVGGAGEVALRVAAQLGPLVVRNWPVQDVQWAFRGVTLRGSKGTVVASRVIFAMNPTDAGRVHFSPPLPAARQLLQEQWMQVPLIKTNVVYPAPFWRADGLGGRVRDSRGCPLSVRDDTPPDGEFGRLVGFTYVYGDRIHGGLEPSLQLDSGGRTHVLLTHLEEYFGPAAREPLVLHETNWGSEPYIAGAMGFTPPGLLTNSGTSLRQPIGPIHWAGTETATRWSNHLNGAVQAGERAAAEVIAALG